METFFALLAICAWNSPVAGDFPSQRPVMWSFDVFFDMHLSKWLSKQSWGWWFETPSRTLWRHCNGTMHMTWWFRYPISTFNHVLKDDKPFNCMRRWPFGGKCLIFLPDDNTPTSKDNMIMECFILYTRPHICISINYFHWHKFCSLEIKNFHKKIFLFCYVATIVYCE